MEQDRPTSPFWVSNRKGINRKKEENKRWRKRIRRGS
jgi:hypothetical protein